MILINVKAISFLYYCVIFAHLSVSSSLFIPLSNTNIINQLNKWKNAATIQSSESLILTLKVEDLNDGEVCQAAKFLIPQYGSKNRASEGTFIQLTTLTHTV